MLTKVAQLDPVRERRRRRRDKHLRPVSRRRDPRGPVHVDPDVSLLGQEGAPGVNADPDPDRPGLEGFGQV